MNGKEFIKECEESYQFFLSELKGVKAADLSFIIELMRASHHIKDIQKLMGGMQPEDENEDTFWVENDSLITMLLNISAAQLRETLKLFWDFSKTSFFKELYKDISKNDRKDIDILMTLNDEYSKKTGFIFEVLVPVRNSMFHYLPERSVSWIEKTKKLELDEKPPFQSIHLEKLEFSLGTDYDKEIYSKYLFWGEKGFDSLMKAQIKLWDTQMSFLKATRVIVKTLLKKEKITKRKFDWFMKYRYGYK